MNKPIIRKIDSLKFGGNLTFKRLKPDFSTFADFKRDNSKAILWSLKKDNEA
jgi:hypothetical protein